jgi:pimeloyl-ACP methyl ester carboxylesterase
VLLLHGFPEYWGTWRKQIPALAEAGYRVYAADLPGYGGTDAPHSYELEELAGAIADLRIELEQDGVHLVGHDWGGMVGHAVASLHPHAVLSLSAICAPHADAFSGVLRDPFQLVRSWYVGAFQIPGVEHLLSSKKLIENVARGSVTEIDSAEEMARALAYYRTNLRPWKLRRKIGSVEQPSLLVHAARDPAIGHSLMEATTEHLEDLRDFLVIDSGHFVQRSRTDELNDALLGFLNEVV